MLATSTSYYAGKGAIRIGELAKKQHYIFFFPSFILLTAITAFRGDFVGTDTMNYKEFFYSITSLIPNFSILLNNILVIEPGYTAINLLLYNLDLSYTWVFFLASAITWYYLYKFFWNDKPILFLAIFFAITTGFMFFTFNGVRQAIAVSIVGASIIHITYKRPQYFILHILLAGTFHYSALLLLPLYYVTPRMKFRIEYWYILIFGAYFISGIGLIEYLLPVLKLLPGGYSYYALSLKSATSNPLSLGSLYQLGMFILIIMHSKIIINGNKFNYQILQLTLLGALLYCLFWQYPVVHRFNMYFYYLQIYIFSLIAQYYIYRKNIIMVFSIFSIFSSVFIYKIYVNDSGCNPFHFVF